MSVTPRISLVAYDDRNPAFIFVAVPDERGRYVRTDRSVAFVPCSFCHATVGEPCRHGSGDGYGGGTHVARREAARKHWGQPADDVLHKPVMPPPVPNQSMDASA